MTPNKPKRVTLKQPTKQLEIPLILWDIDGTLLAPMSGGENEYEEAISWVIPNLPLERVVTHGKTDRQVVEEYLANEGDELHVAKVLERLDIMSSRYETSEHKIPALPRVTDALGITGALGYRNALLTGNTPARAMSKLRGAGIDCDRISWEESFFGINARSRSSITREARTVFPDRPMVIIGDTVRDGEAAADAGIAFIGVETGAYTGDQLLEAGAIATVGDLVRGIEDLQIVLNREFKTCGKQEALR